LEVIQKRIDSPEYQRDMQLPEELQGRATVINNDDWEHTKQKIDQFYQRVKEATKKIPNEG
ncbi:guanylate kinase, partial [Enterococcus faecium]|nr:guanylate kinase [Enterococcus faecium]